jgi:hypothetical protein
MEVGEMTTSALKGLSFTALPQATIDPVTDRRTRVIAKLEEQKLLLADPAYLRTVKTTQKKDGEKTVVETKQKVSKWWRPAPTGYAFFVRAGVKPLEFERGKAAVAVASLEKLPAVIDTLIMAVKTGELDQQLAASAKPVGGKKTKTEK